MKLTRNILALALFTCALLIESAHPQQVSGSGFAVPNIAPTGLTATYTATGGSLSLTKQGTLCYAVTGIDASSNESAMGNTVCVNLTTTTGQIALAWPSLAYASSYRVYKGISPGTARSYFTSNTNSYTDTGSATPVLWAGPGSNPGAANSYAVTLNAAGLACIGGISCGGAGTVPSGSGFPHITSGVQDGAARAVDISTADVTGTIPAARMPALTGDITTSAGAVATTLAVSGVSAGSCGDATHSCTITFDAKGRATAQSNNVISAGGTGTVTHTAGALTAGAVALGNGAADLTVSGVTVDGSNNISTTGSVTTGSGGTAGIAKINTGSCPAGTAATTGICSDTGDVPKVRRGTAAAIEIVDLSTAQALTNKSIVATEVNSGTLAAAQMPALTGDITTSAGAVATTLATVNSNVGTFGDATHANTVTVDGKGRITAISSNVISGGSSTSILGASSNDGINAGSGGTVYFAVMGPGYSAGGTETTRQWVVPVAGTISKLSVQFLGTQGACNQVVTVRKNAAATTLTVTTNGLSNNVVSDTTHSFTVVAGDLLTMQSVNGVCSASDIQSWGMILQ